MLLKDPFQIEPQTGRSPLYINLLQCLSVQVLSGPALIQGEILSCSK